MSIGYETFGSGAHKTLVLHGWFGDETFMRPMHDALSAAEFTYVFPAYRGYGASKHLTGAYTIEEISADVLALADKLGLDRCLTGAYTIEEISADVLALADKLGLDRFSLVGHSMGGKFIQRIALDAPARIRKMVAVTPVPAAAVPFDDQGWGLFSGAASQPGNRRAIIDFSTGTRLSKTWIEAMARRSEGTSTREAFSPPTCSLGRGPIFIRR